jgi:D-amino-acid dehydrogenase
MAREIVVLGAGMVGTSAALALQARGYDVVLLDRAAPGSETSYGNAGFIQGEAFEPYALPRDIATLWGIACKTDNSVDWDVLGLWSLAPSLFTYWRNSAPARHRRTSLGYAALIRRALDDHARWIAASDSEGMMQRGGYRLIFRDPAALEAQARKAEQSRALYGVRYDVEDRVALAAAEPALRRPLAGAIHWHDTWTCSDPGALVKAYARLFARQGGTLLDAEFRGLQPSGKGWRVDSSAGAIDTEHVVVALGPWSPQALAPLGYRIRMVRKRGYHMHFDYPRTGTNRQLTLPIIDADMGAVYAPMRAGLRIATGADLSAGAAADVPRQLRRAHAAACELLDVGPPLDEAAWSGVRPCLPDMMPLVGAAPRHPGLWFNFGHGHQGFTLGPTTGNLLAGIIAGDPDVDSLPLSPRDRS